MMIMHALVMQHLQAFYLNKSRDESFFELCGRSDSRQRPPVELAACQFTEVQRPRCLGQRVGERVAGRLAQLLTSPRFDGTRHGRRCAHNVDDLMKFAGTAALRSGTWLAM